MAKEKKDSTNRYIPTKNYIIVLLIIIGIIFLTVYIKKWHNIKINEEMVNHYLSTTNTINFEVDEFNEINNILTESPSYYFVLIGYTKDEKTYNLEKDIKSIIDEYNLSDNFYLIDATNMKKDNDYIDKINKALNIKKNKITKLPIILYFENNRLIKSVKTAKDLQDLIKLYRIDEISQ